MNNRIYRIIEKPDYDFFVVDKYIPAWKLWFFRGGDKWERVTYESNDKERDWSTLEAAKEWVQHKMLEGVENIVWVSNLDEAMEKEILDN